MPPFKKIPKTEAAAAALGLASMTSFFSAKKLPGPGNLITAKKTPKSGRPAAEKPKRPRPRLRLRKLLRSSQRPRSRKLRGRATLRAKA